MTTEREEASALLQGIAGTEKRTREILTYARAGDYMILWGILWVVGYAFGDRIWPYTRALWWTLDGIGIAGTGVITWRAVRCMAPQASRFLLLRPLVGIVVLIGFGTMWTWLAHFGGREQSAFWPTFCAALLFVFGLWAGRALAAGGALVFALTMAGYFWSGPWFDLWLAGTSGGALILGGLWLRR
ncbi:MAG: hypothetical protein WDM91_20910 [Rhizomicrobium sp.]